MKKIVTAINNPNLNERLKEEKDIEIIGKDIQYKEAIIELLENKKYANIDILIINEKIPGEINFLNLINKIKIINKNIKIIIILEKENNYLENKLKELNINSIYFNNKVNLEKLIKIIKEKELNKEEELKEEIKRLEKIIESNKIKSKNLEKNRRKKTKINKKQINITQKKETEVITLSGGPKSGKTMTSLILSKILERENKLILLINIDIDSEKLNILLNIKNNLKNWNEVKYTNNYFNIVKISKEKEKNKTKIFKIKKLKNKKNLFENKKIKKIDNKNLIIKNEINQKINKKNSKKIRINKKNNIKKNRYKINTKNKTEKIIKLLKIKISKKIYLINNLKIINNYNKNLNQIIENVINLNIHKYDYIIIDLDYRCNDEINKQILEKSTKIFLLGEPNLLGIKELENNLLKYTNKYNIDRRKINILLNKYSKKSLNIEIVKNYFPEILKFYKIYYNENYDEIINTNFKLKKNLLNKKIKKII